MAGKAEKNFREAVRWFRGAGIWVHKNRDGIPGSAASEGGGVDYAIALGIMQVEVKNTNEEGALVDGLSEKQRHLLDKFGGYVFVVLWSRGYPALPGGGDGYLVPWLVYRDWWDNLPQPAPGTKVDRVHRHPKPGKPGIPEDWDTKYKLGWQPGTMINGKRTDGVFIIPWEHIFWEELVVNVNEMYNQFGSVNKIKRTYELGGAT